MSGPTILRPESAGSCVGGWFTWCMTNQAPREPFDGPQQQRQRISGPVAWFIEGDVVELGRFRVEQALGPRPRRVELREGGPDGRLVRAFECEPGQGLDGREKPDPFVGGIHITLVGEADVSMSVEYRITEGAIHV